MLEVRQHRMLADKYGMIMLVPNAVSPGRWDVIHEILEKKIDMTGDPGTGAILVPPLVANPDVRNIDAAMQRILRTDAIDPDKIAIVGFSDGGSYALYLARHNLDIFSRVAAMSPMIPFGGTGPKHAETQFFVSGGVAEQEHMVRHALEISHALRNEGHLVETVIGLREHKDYYSDDDYMWSWLARSWTGDTARSKHSPAPAFPTRTAADSDPVLNMDILTRMTTFWSRFMQEPDSIRTEARMAHPVRQVLHLSTDSVSVVTVDMQILASRYPSVAADLRTAGLTVQQEEADRAAILRVGLTRFAGKEVAPVTNASVLGQNLVFRSVHDQAFAALEATGMWVAP